MDCRGKKPKQFRRNRDRDVWQKDPYLSCKTYLCIRYLSSINFRVNETPALITRPSCASMKNRTTHILTGVISLYCVGLDIMNETFQIRRLGRHDGGVRRVFVVKRPTVHYFVKRSSGDSRAAELVHEVEAPRSSIIIGIRLGPPIIVGLQNIPKDVSAVVDAYPTCHWFLAMSNGLASRREFRSLVRTTPSPSETPLTM